MLSSFFFIPKFLSGERSEEDGQVQTTDAAHQLCTLTLVLPISIPEAGLPHFGANKRRFTQFPFFQNHDATGWFHYLRQKKLDAGFFSQGLRLGTWNFEKMCQSTVLTLLTL